MKASISRTRQCGGAAEADGALQVQWRHAELPAPTAETPNAHVDYGSHLHVGARTFINFVMMGRLLPGPPPGDR
ncbi:hypothetical protein OHA72_41475 [Dactylosporangium sp. NBC_01737]|uniref:hypothetical protein n=1 Tax=Dactylosporangium sp. NBC_01737 TaxID=2975959 RepID=UPI002E0F0A59|nr:hypothetical protein OHA72_41475 [Dactylosporangium sp. NBC_01737]